MVKKGTKRKTRWRTLSIGDGGGTDTSDTGITEIKQGNEKKKLFKIFAGRFEHATFISTSRTGLRIYIFVLSFLYFYVQSVYVWKVVIYNETF